jgi:hypothetical protein
LIQFDEKMVEEKTASAAIGIIAVVLYVLSPPVTVNDCRWKRCNHKQYEWPTRFIGRDDAAQTQQRTCALPRTDDARPQG